MHWCVHSAVADRLYPPSSSSTVGPTSQSICSGHMRRVRLSEWSQRCGERLVRVRSGAYTVCAWLIVAGPESNTQGSKPHLAHVPKSLRRHVAATEGVALRSIEPCRGKKPRGRVGRPSLLLCSFWLACA